MAKRSFCEIRRQYPESYLLLVDYEGVELPDGKLDVVAAEEAQAFANGDDMLDAFKSLRRSGKKVMFCTPEYKDRLVVDRLPGMRIFW